MRYKGAIGVSILMLLGCAAPCAQAGSGEERQITWDGMSAVVGQHLRMVMPDGARIEGKAIGVEVDALVVEIGKTTNKTAYPKGRFLVPRATLRAIDVVQRSTVHWRLVGVAIGGGIGYLAARGARNFSGAAAVGLGALGGGVPIVGYLLGNAADRRATTYVITP